MENRSQETRTMEGASLMPPPDNDPTANTNSSSPTFENDDNDDDDEVLDFSPQNPKVAFLTRLRFLTVQQETCEQRNERLNRFRQWLRRNHRCRKVLIRPSFFAHLDELTPGAFLDLLELPSLPQLQHVEIRGDGSSTILSAFALARLLAGRTHLQTLLLERFSLMPVSYEAYHAVTSAVGTCRNLQHLLWMVRRHEDNVAPRGPIPDELADTPTTILQLVADGALTHLRDFGISLHAGAFMNPMAGPRVAPPHKYQDLVTLMPNLTHLQLQGHSFREDECQALVQGLQDPNCRLTTLDLATWWMPKANYSALLRAMEHNKSLRTLIFVGASDSSGAFAHRHECDPILVRALRLENETLCHFLGPQPEPRPNHHDGNNNNSVIHQLQFYLRLNRSGYRTRLPNHAKALWSPLLARLGSARDLANPSLLWVVLQRNSDQLVLG